MNIFVFDIETVQDTKNGRILYNLNNDKNDREVAEIMFEKRHEKKRQFSFSSSSFAAHRGYFQLHYVLKTNLKLGPWVISIRMNLPS